MRNTAWHCLSSKHKPVCIIQFHRQTNISICHRARDRHSDIAGTQPAKCNVKKKKNLNHSLSTAFNVDRTLAVFKFQSHRQQHGWIWYAAVMAELLLLLAQGHRDLWTRVASTETPETRQTRGEENVHKTHSSKNLPPPSKNAAATREELSIRAWHWPHAHLHVHIGGQPGTPGWGRPHPRRRAQVSGLPLERVETRPTHKRWPQRTGKVQPWNERGLFTPALRQTYSR